MTVAQQLICILGPVLVVFIGMGKECADCGAEMNMAGQLRGAGGVHSETCKYRDEEGSYE